MGLLSTWRRARRERGKNYTKAYFHVHFIWKYRFFVPLLRIGEKVMSKHLLTTVPDKPEFEHLRLLSEAVEESIRPWAEWHVKDYNERRSKAPPFRKWLTNDKGEDDIVAFTKISSAKWVILMKDFLVTMCVNDTAYNPLFRIITEKLAHKMRKRP